MTEDLVTFDHFSDTECDKIIELGESLEHEPSLIKGDVVDKNTRFSKQAWIHPGPETMWLFQRSAHIFGNTLVKTLQSFQYTVYDYGGHYTWHRDIGFGDKIQKDRIMTAILNLSDHKDYEGGHIEVKNGSDVETMVRTRGLVTIFPADTLHRVTPVTKGIRKTLVMWGLK